MLWNITLISYPSPLVWTGWLNLYFLGSDPDQHVLGAAGPVLDAGAGRPAAQLRHDLHEPADHRPSPRQQAGSQEEDHWDSKPQEDVRGGKVIYLFIDISNGPMNQFTRRRVLLDRVLDIFRLICHDSKLSKNYRDEVICCSWVVQDPWWRWAKTMLYCLHPFKTPSVANIISSLLDPFNPVHARLFVACLHVNITSFLA